MVNSYIIDRAYFFKNYDNVFAGSVFHQNVDDTSHRIKFVTSKVEKQFLAYLDSKGVTISKEN